MSNHNVSWQAYWASRRANWRIDSDKVVSDMCEMCNAGRPLQEAAKQQAIARGQAVRTAMSEEDPCQWSLNYYRAEVARLAVENARLWVAIRSLADGNVFGAVDVPANTGDIFTALARWASGVLEGDKA